MKIGVLGAGQLGQMMGLAGKPLDHSFVYFDHPRNPPAKIAGEVIQTDQNYIENLDHFLSKVDLVTYEFENIPINVVEKILKKKPVYPSIDSLHYSQNRVNEKTLFNELDIPTAKWQSFENAQQVISRSSEILFPCVMKTTRDGYDGHGQCVLKSEKDLHKVKDFPDKPVIVEPFVQFNRELSIIAVISLDGKIKTWPLAENHHKDGILRTTIAPAPKLAKAKENLAKEYITRLVKKTGHVGVMTLELFDTEAGLLANEMAPRVHNSGHWTMDGAVASQFENHVRAITGMDLASTEATSVSGMVNILGAHGDVDRLHDEKTFVHLYGKEERPKRKLGHFNLVGNQSLEELRERFERFKAYIEY